MRITSVYTCFCYILYIHLKMLTQIFRRYYYKPAAQSNIRHIDIKLNDNIPRSRQQSLFYFSQFIFWTGFWPNWLKCVCVYIHMCESAIY